MDYFSKREKMKEEYPEYFDKSVSKKYQEEVVPAK